MDTEAAHSRIWQTSDFWGIVYLVMGGLLNWAWPLSFSPALPPIALYATGGFLLLSGLGLLIATKRKMNSLDQPDGPGKPTTQLIKDGPFAFSRNPIYVAFAALTLACALGFDMPWWLVLWVPLLLIVNYLLIAPEERYLLKSFGDEYVRYCLAVRRWL